MVGRVEPHVGHRKRVTFQSGKGIGESTGRLSKISQSFEREYRHRDGDSQGDVEGTGGASTVQSAPGTDSAVRQ